MVKEDILNTLEELGQEEFQKLKRFLQQPETLPELPTINKKCLEGAKTLDMVDLMMQIYTLSLTFSFIKSYHISNISQTSGCRHKTRTIFKLALVLPTPTPQDDLHTPTGQVV